MAIRVEIGPIFSRAVPQRLFRVIHPRQPQVDLVTARPPNQYEGYVGDESSSLSPEAIEEGSRGRQIVVHTPKGEGVVAHVDREHMDDRTFSFTMESLGREHSMTVHMSEMIQRQTLFEETARSPLAAAQPLQT